MWEFMSLALFEYLNLIFSMAPNKGRGRAFVPTVDRNSYAGGGILAPVPVDSSSARKMVLTDVDGGDKRKSDVISSLLPVNVAREYKKKASDGIKDVCAVPFELHHGGLTEPVRNLRR